MQEVKRTHLGRPKSLSRILPRVLIPWTRRARSDFHHLYRNLRSPPNSPWVSMLLSFLSGSTSRVTIFLHEPQSCTTILAAHRSTNALRNPSSLSNLAPKNKEKNSPILRILHQLLPDLLQPNPPYTLIVCRRISFRIEFAHPLALKYWVCGGIEFLG